MNKDYLSIAECLRGTPAWPQWKKIGVKDHFGFDIPLFSLHSKNSCGIGEFPDLIPFIDWSNELSFSIIQLLPLNDTSGDASPYNLHSAFALNPIHIGLTSLPGVEHYQDLLILIKSLQSLNKTQRISYNQVRQQKFQFLELYYKYEGDNIQGSSHYQTFVQENAWLKGYSLFKATHNGSNDPNFHTFIQYLCYLQLKQVKDYANARGIWIKGDIPILVASDSADVWLHPNLFMTQFSAGAPPDMYNEEGQYWGFPLYDWDEIEKEHYQWWKERLRYASLFYDLYRIDHVVGFFRIWSIPRGLKASEGFYIPIDRAKWIHQGKHILQMMLQSCLMLPIGEDLGTVPPEVRRCLTELGICGTKVIRWERAWEEDKLFIPVADYPPISLTTVSTHDSETLSIWGLNDKEEQRAYKNFKGWPEREELTLEQKFDILRDSFQSGSLFHINLLQDVLNLIPELSWSKPSDERINVPGLVSDTNWTYRFKPSVEQIAAHENLRILINDLIK